MAIGGDDGSEYDDSEQSRPLLPPEDRIWRHPSEMGGGTEPPPPRGRRGPGRRRRLAAGIAVGAAALVAFGVHRSMAPQPAVHPSVVTASTVSLNRSAGGSPSVLAVPAATVGTSVVAVYAAAGRGVTTGSGFVWQSDGSIVTTRALVAGARDLWVVDSRGQRHDARLVAADPVTDVAVLNAAEPAIPPAPVEAAASLKDGDVVMAVSPPARPRRAPVVTVGTVRAVGINMPGPGNTLLLGVLSTTLPAATPQGAPVVDSDGDVVGLVAGSGGGDAVLVPGAVAMDAGTQLLQAGKVAHGWMGVEGIPSGDDGILVKTVVPGSPGQAAGIRAGDLIGAVDGRRVTGMDDLQAAVRLRHPGEVVNLSVTRAATAHIVPVRLGQMPGG